MGVELLPSPESGRAKSERTSVEVNTHSTRPDGLVWKKDSGARMSLSIAALCRLLEARSDDRKNTWARTTLMSRMDPTKMAYTQIQ